MIGKKRCIIGLLALVLAAALAALAEVAKSTAPRSGCGGGGGSAANARCAGLLFQNDAHNCLLIGLNLD